MKTFNLWVERAKAYITDKNQKKLIFLFSASYYMLMLSILYFVFSENLGVYTYDSGYFHREAIRYANLLNESGITSLPSIVRYDEYQSPAIFGGIIYYLFGFHHPTLIILSNILIKSISVYFLYSIFFKISEKKFVSFIAVSPFLFFPTEFGNIALINKGIFFSLGIILIFSSFVSSRKILIIKLFFAFLILSFVRPQYLHWVYNIVTPPTVTRVEPLVNAKLTWHDNFKTSTRWVNPNWFWKICKKTRFDKVEYILSNKWRQKQKKQLSILAYIWEKICSRFDGLAKTLLSVRNDPSIMKSKSNFDYSSLPSNGQEMLLYIPKGFVIGLLKPFPTEWFVLENRTNKMFYLAASFEAICIYFGLMLLPFSLYKYRAKKPLLFTTILCLGGILIYGTVSYNLGCLYRHRGIFINIVCGIGLLSFPLLFAMAREPMRIFRRFYVKTKSNLTNLSNFTENYRITG